MSSDAFAEFGTAPRALPATLSRAVRGRRAPAGEAILLRRSGTTSDAHRLLAAGGTDAIDAGALIGMGGPRADRDDLTPRRGASPWRSRIAPDAVSGAVQLADCAVSLAAGLFAFTRQSALHWPLDPIAALAALLAIVLMLRLPSADPNLLKDFSRQQFGRRLTQGVFRMLLPFVFTIATVVALLPAGSPDAAALLQWLGMWAFGSVAGIIVVRLALTGLAVHWRDDGRLKDALAIYGTGEVAERLLEHLRQSCGDTVELVGVFDDRAPGRVASPQLRALVRGNANDLIELSRQRGIDRVIVALPHSAEQRVFEVLNKLRRMPVEISLAPDLAGFNLPGKEATELGGLPLLAFYRRPLTLGQSLVKNAFDKVASALALIVLSPLLLAIVVAIKLDTKGPVFFRQNRHGFGHRVIRVYKFRTMFAEAADPNGVQQACANDPRITPVGAILRKWSLDELPQLINVLRGEMSIVGPRPHAVSMRVEQRLNEEIVPDYVLRHHLKPGITGWAQVNGYHGPVASEQQLRTRVAYDLEYINNWSLWFDLWTILRTVKLCLGMRHAY